MTAAGGALTVVVAAVTAGPLSMWTVVLLAGWLAVVAFVWLLLVASGRASPG